MDPIDVCQQGFYHQRKTYKSDNQKRPEINYYRQGLRPDYYYRTGPYAGPHRYRPQEYYDPYRPGPQIEPYKWALSPARFLASSVMHRRLINEEGKHIGRVKDLHINRNNNMVEKIILSTVDVLGEDVYVALSYEPLGFTSYGMVYDIAPGELKDFIYLYKK